ncbi:hypothetical protein J6590_030900, partial [Homalodisca vitripennis]
ALEEAESVALKYSNQDEGIPISPMQQSILEQSISDLTHDILERDQNNIEENLTMAAKIGSALLEENLRLKEKNSRHLAKITSLEASIEELKTMEDKYLASIENNQQKIKDLESQMVKEKHYLNEVKQIFEEHDIKQAETIIQLEKKIKSQVYDIRVLKEKLQLISESGSNNPIKPRADSQTQNDLPSITYVQPTSTPINVDIILLKEKYGILEEKLSNLEAKLKYNTEQTVTLPKNKHIKLNRTSSSNQMPHRKSQNKFSVSLQVKKMLETENNKIHGWSNQHTRTFIASMPQPINAREQNQSATTTGRVCQTPTQKQSTTTTTGRVCQTPPQKQCTTTTTDDGPTTQLATFLIHQYEDESPPEKNKQVIKQNTGSVIFSQDKTNLRVMSGPPLNA